MYGCSQPRELWFNHVHTIVSYLEGRTLSTCSTVYMSQILWTQVAKIYFCFLQSSLLYPKYCEPVETGESEYVHT